MTTPATPEPIYLDHNATTPIAPEVFDAMLPYFKQHYGNPSSDHPLGYRAREAIEEARVQVASLIGAASEEIVFTSGGTESNNLAIRGSVAAAAPGRRRIVTSQVEHPATARPCELLETQGWTVTRVPVTSSRSAEPRHRHPSTGHRRGAAHRDARAKRNRGDHAGARGGCSRARSGIITHTDAAQAIGKIDVTVDTLGVDLLSIAGHKYYAPKGIGALYVRSGTPLQPVLLGGDQERGLRPGTENVAYIVGLAAACRLARTRLNTEPKRLRTLRDQLWAEPVRPDPRTGATHPRGQQPAQHADRVVPRRPRPRRTRPPTACSRPPDPPATPDSTPPPRLCSPWASHPMGLGAVRLSLGHDNTPADIDAAADILVAAYENHTRYDKRPWHCSAPSMSATCRRTGRRGADQQVVRPRGLKAACRSTRFRALRQPRRWVRRPMGLSLECGSRNWPASTRSSEKALGAHMTTVATSRDGSLTVQTNVQTFVYVRRRRPWSLA